MTIAEARTHRSHDQRREEAMTRGIAGKGSHRIFALADTEGKEVGRFGLTGTLATCCGRFWRAPRAALHLFGEKWTEGR
jgi:hypothetical protein